MSKRAIFEYILFDGTKGRFSVSAEEADRIFDIFMNDGVLVGLEPGKRFILDTTSIISLVEVEED